MIEWWTWGAIFVVVNFLLAVGVTVHAVLHKRDVRAVIGWVGLAWLAPIVGPGAYMVLGINRIQRKASRLNVSESWDEPHPRFEPEDLDRIASFEKTHPNLVSLAVAGKKLAGHDLLPGNSVDPLIDGDDAYPAMCKAIEAAQHSVTLLSYIFDSDRAGEKFLNSLVDAQARGVDVRVLIDSVGSAYSKPRMVERLEQVGIPVAAFLPTFLSRFSIYANMRNHRKILVTDGRVGFTGGTNIREGHWLGLDPTDPVQCLHFKLTGPVVAHMQRMFAIDWAFATGEKISGPKWFPELNRTGDVWARGIEHGPDERFEVLADLIAAALAIAQHRIRILSPYFLPSVSLINALNVAAMRGVDVEIYIPAENNIALAQWACTAQLWQILEKGCRVFYSPPPFDHTKLMIVDDSWSLIGSTNWDPRSLRLNFEFNVECYSSKLATELNGIVDRKTEAANEITLQQVNSRPLPIQLRDGLARLFSPYL